MGEGSENDVERSLERFHFKAFLIYRFCHITHKRWNRVYNRFDKRGYVMSMRQMLNEFVKSIDQSDIGSNELFNMEMVVGKQNLFVYTSHLNAQQLDMILEHLASGIDVTLVTTKHVDESLKNRMSKELFSKKETTIKWERFIRIGYVILGIGVLMLGRGLVLSFIWMAILSRGRMKLSVWFCHYWNCI